MSDTKPVGPKPDTFLSAEQLERIGGGDCTPEEWIRITDELKGAYDSLIDLASYMIERISNATK